MRAAMSKGVDLQNIVMNQSSRIMSRETSALSNSGAMNTVTVIVTVTEAVRAQ